MRSDWDIFEDLGEALPQSLAEVIQEAADLAIRDIKNNLVTGAQATGRLRDSIRATVDESNLTLGIVMLDYGYYQNFGVVGTDNTKTQYGVDEATATAFGVSEDYQFKFDKSKSMIGGNLPFGVRKKIHQQGLDAKQFFNVEEFVERVAAYVNNNLEL